MPIGTWISEDCLLSYAHGYVAWLVFGITQHFVQKEEHKSVGSERMREGHHHADKRWNRFKCLGKVLRDEAECIQAFLSA